MFDETYEEALAQFEEEKETEGWTDEDTPKPHYYHPKFENPVCYQVYEEVSEGTPVSPVFDTPEEVEAWLIGTGVSPEAAKKFVEIGWCLSGTFSRADGYRSNYETLA